eukprot:Phypoly_transcript_10867.p1 GENE.Phypoly_transcript_10867~~Phypoly_transcript_10867.p1  ORF type:complete len:357 (+),score=68.35 Phypoly_transcript_10867:196-1266(+)
MSKRQRPEDESIIRADERLATGYTHKSPEHPDLCPTHERARRAVFFETIWRKLAPELHVEDDEFSQENCTSPHYSWENERNQILTEGFAELKNIDWGNIKTQHIACAAANLQRHGWPPVFVLVYDEVWLMAFKLIGMLRAINSHLKFNMDFWTWYIDPLKTDKGKGPHRDRSLMPFEEDGTERLPKSASVWVALTDATPTNGCIYAVPAKWDENYYKTGQESTDFDPQNLRALPIKAGDALAWTGRTIHFGSRAAPDAPFPRMSIEFAASVADFEDPNQRLGRPFPQFTDAGGDDVSLRMPTLRERLRVIASQLHTYEYREPVSDAVKQILATVNRTFEEGYEEEEDDDDYEDDEE